MNIGFYIESIKEVEKAKLLVKTIEENIEDSNIYLITKHDITIENCITIQSAISTHHDLYFVDKVQAAAIFEAAVTAPYLWIDSDTIFLKKVNKTFFGNERISLNPVDTKNIGVTKDQEMTDIWLKTMKYLKIEKLEHSVTTIISKETIFPYYNMGMVYVNHHDSLFKQTYEAIIELFKDEQIKKSIASNPLNYIFYHQLIFSLMVEKIYHEHISPLGQYINYPFHLMEKDCDQPNFERLISIRYDTYFKTHEIPDFLKKIININKSYL